MTKEEYIQYRNEGNAFPAIYDYYIEKCSKNCLDAGNFLQIFLRWPGQTIATEQVLGEYDIKYEITKVEHLKTGKILKYYG